MTVLASFDLPPVLSLEEFERESAPYFAPPPYVSKFGAVTWADMDLPGPEHEWLIKNVITRGERSMMVGASQSGKSFLVIDLAMAIARGVPWLGNKAMRGGVVFQAGEGGRGIKKRIRAYRLEHGLSPEDKIPFVLLPKTVDLFAGDAAANLLIEETKHWASTFDCPLELVVIDTLSTATPGADENSSKDVSPVLARCERIASETRASVLLVHHMNSGGQKPRGHTSIMANLDSVLKVEKLEEMDIDRRAVREIEIAKQKDGESGKKWRFVLPAVEIGRDGDGEPITSCVVRLPNVDGEPGETSKATDAGIRLTPQCEVFLRAIYRALADGGENAPVVLGLPSGTRVVHWRVLAEKFAEMAFDGADEEDPKKRANALSQAMKRHGEKLMQLNIIMRQKPFVWLTGRKVRGFSRRADSASEKSRPSEAPPPSPGPADQEEVFF
ncbi:MAG: AAA family ATPase [Dechloromonas sp.]|nr:AAA family ATPase [Dechloromonas sp.]